MDGAATALRPVVLVGGPTASGKSDLALAVAEQFGGAVVNADSMQVYRELPVLTAQPGAAAQARAPHRLYGVLSAAERCSAGRWRALALTEIAELHEAGQLPVVVGGTGLYLDALQRGLADIPPVPPEIGREAQRLIDTQGAPALHARLAAEDPETASALRPSDSQRIARAWGVLRATGTPLAVWRRRPPPDAAAFRFFRVLLMPPREVVYPACDRRFAWMVENGALAEVEALLRLGLDPDLPAMKAVGVPPLRRYLAGEIGLEEAIRLGRRDTRRYAKRQMTWFRHRYDAEFVRAAQFSESALTEIFSFISDFLLTEGG